MIAVTTNSLNKNSTLPTLPNAVECAFLERETGADFMLSIAPYPCRTPALLQKHIDAGAVLVQHKDTSDLVSSLGERLDDSIARMCSVAHRQYQRVLLSVGMFSDNKGDLIVNGHNSGVKWVQYMGAMEKWNARGGVVSNVDRANLIPAWCELKLKHLQEMRDSPVKMVYQRERMPDDPPLPMEDDPLQLCIPVRDARNALVNIPDVGPKLVEWLWRVTDGNFGHALTLLTHPEAAKVFDDKPRNLGTALIEKCRTYFGLSHPNYITQIEYDVEKSDESTH